jgi:hypothetical protein
MHFDYMTLGHVTVDVLEDGSRQPGGTAFYSALQAARLGRRTQILTRGRAEELEALLEPYRPELEVTVLAAQSSTTLHTSGSGTGRRQRMLAWAGALPQDLLVDSEILHIAPVARETPTRWRGTAQFVGLTPQGLARRWSGAGGEISLHAPDDAAVGDGAAPAASQAPPGRGAADALELAERCDAVVVSDEERAGCAGLIAAARRGGAVVAITAGPGPATVLLPDGRELRSPVAPLEDPRADLGAGDVFAAAFFVALAEEQPPERAAAFASAAAAVRMQGLGPGAIGARPEILERLNAAGAGR